MQSVVCRGRSASVTSAWRGWLILGPKTLCLAFKYQKRSRDLAMADQIDLEARLSYNIDCPVWPKFPSEVI